VVPTLCEAVAVAHATTPSQSAEQDPRMRNRNTALTQHERFAAAVRTLCVTLTSQRIVEAACHMEVVTT
jgi:hypothetical protein